MARKGTEHIKNFIMYSCHGFIYLFINTLQHKCWFYSLLYKVYEQCVDAYSKLAIEQTMEQDCYVENSPKNTCSNSLSQ